ncbi:phosphate acyltransferase PlsX [Acholeplasma vituli]|uniref:Phosphate acyltransferase n=1 Tax=Paracholeplasma vituli TaxID=69473 RepID=A0ABT2PXB6_9MOLU|nr:phosphate acyltransferase PlsX [Paracholeplasma vituli]MCU0104372.1 phosphate acyltransferase PlsX [Paracholeplasma vituli]
MIKIAIDAMGGDNAPLEIVKGCDLALDAYPDIELVLFGNETEIKSLLKHTDRVSIVHTTEVISMGEKDPVKAIRNHRDSSMVKALYSAKNGETSAVVSAGPTQALIVGAHLVIKRMEKMHRVALAPIIPSIDQKGRILLDVGANIELRPEHMLELALYATVVSKEYLGVEKPTVALMNIGTEEGKGRELEKETFKLLKENPQINFLGNIEGKEILTTEANIVLTDGYTGNVLMKTMEGTAKGMGNMLKEEIKSSLMGKIGYLFMRKNLKRFQKRMDASEIGGAMIFGIKAPVIKAHGSSNAYAFKNAIRQARQFVSNQVVEKVEVALKDIQIEESSDSN